MDKDCLITEADVEQLNADIQSKQMFDGVRDFLEGEPHLSYVTGVRLGMLHGALDQAGIAVEHRRIIEEEVHVLLGVHVYLLQRATHRLLDGLLPSDRSDGAT